MLTNKKKNKQLRRKKLIIAGLYSIAMFSFAASTCGTYAWYFYASKTGFNFRARTVGNFDNLQIGIASPKQLGFYRQYDLLEEDRSILDKGYYIYWARGGLTAKQINFVSRSNGYATEKLGPVTTGKYYHNDDYGQLELHNGPSKGLNYDLKQDNFSQDQYNVHKNRYTELIFVFRIGDYTQGTAGKPDVPIYLNVDKPTTNQVDARYALRFYISNALQGGSTFLVAPMYDNDGYTTVGGPLDLASDGYYDTSYNKTTGVKKEISYGEYKEGPYFIPASQVNDETVSKEDRTTFLANHDPEALVVDMENSKPEIAEYYGANKLLQTDFYVGKTDPFMRNYAVFKMKIFIEGWDPSVVDSADLSEFNLGMTFFAK